MRRVSLILVAVPFLVTSVTVKAAQQQDCWVSGENEPCPPPEAGYVLDDGDEKQTVTKAGSGVSGYTKTKSSTDCHYTKSGCVMKTSSGTVVDKNSATCVGKGGSGTGTGGPE